MKKMFRRLARKTLVLMRIQVPFCDVFCRWYGDFVKKSFSDHDICVIIINMSFG